MGKCDGIDCFYNNNSSYTMDDLTRCVVNAYENHVHAYGTTPDVIDLCDMCIQKYYTSTCELCNREMIDDCITICEYAVCRFCIRNLPLDTCPNADVFKKFFNFAENLTKDWDTKPECDCSPLEICEVEINGLESWISSIIQQNIQKKQQKTERIKKLREMAEAHLIKRGYTSWEAWRLIRKFGRRVRYMEHKTIVQLLLNRN